VSESEIRARQRADWTAATPGWIEDRVAVAERPSPVTLALIEDARIARGAVVLDMACGSGDPAFAIARAVGPGGRVVGLDLVAPMVDAATELATRAGIHNVAFRAVEHECELGVEAGTFDAVVCRFGLMFMPDPTAAARSWRATLRGGGRIAVSTWASFAAIELALRIARKHAALPPPDPSAPGVLALPTPERLRDVLRRAGYADVAVRSVRSQVSVEAPPAEWWDVFARTAGPLVTLLRSVPEPVRSGIRAEAVAALAERHPAGTVVEYGDALVASACTND
jgi:SAM-dependent methyltransferase